MKTGEAYIDSPEQTAVDVAFAAPMLVVGAPVAAGIAYKLWREQSSEGFPIFRQERVAHYDLDSLSREPGQLATHAMMVVTKLRTMVHQELTGKTDTFGARDPRATEYAKDVRQAGGDEWPQLLDVLQGALRPKSLAGQPKLHMVGIRAQIEQVLEQRRAIDRGLFEDWIYWYNRNLGLFGAGQSYAHRVGSYVENSTVVKEVMRRDITSHEHASAASDAYIILKTPFDLLLHIAQERRFDRLKPRGPLIGPESNELKVLSTADNDSDLTVTA